MKHILNRTEIPLQSTQSAEVITYTSEGANALKQGSNKAQILIKPIGIYDGYRLYVGNDIIAEVCRHSQGYWYAIGHNGFTPSYDLNILGDYNVNRLLELLKKEIQL